LKFADNPSGKRKIKRYGRPNRAAVIPPESPEGDFEIEQATNDPLKPKDCKKRVFRGGSIGEFWRIPSRSRWSSLSGYRFFESRSQPFQVDFAETIIFCDEHHNLKRQAVKNTKKMRFKTNKNDLLCFLCDGNSD
jgi:hypothetical protein